MIRILITDDQRLMRTGIRGLLKDVADFKIAGEAETGEEAVAACRRVDFDVALMDIDLPGISGLEATQRIKMRFPSIQIIGLSEHHSGPYPLQMLEAGAVGYLSKSCERYELEGAIRSAVRGERYVGAEVAKSLVSARLSGVAGALDALSQRELEVMLQLSRARSLRQIAEALSLSPKTISTYRTRVCRKLGVSTDVELTHAALRTGLLNLATI